MLLIFRNMVDNKLNNHKIQLNCFIVYECPDDIVGIKQVGQFLFLFHEML